MASPEEQLATMLSNLPDKTGRPLHEWLKLISETGFEKHGQIVKLLKSKHEITHGFANLIAAKALESDQPINLVDSQYSGPKANLKPLYDKVVKFALTLGADVEVAPKKTSVSLRRKKQFALIVPATKTRIDLGLTLKGFEPTGRLQPYNAMCSHRVKLETFADFDQEVKAWVSDAYSNCG